MNSVAILGLGLMGGSLGLALKKAGFQGSIAGYARNPVTREEALRRKAVDRVFDDPCQAVAGADFVIFCVPVLSIPGLVAAVRRLLKDFARWFPSLADVRFECAWGGPMDVTGLHVPFFGTFEPGNLHYGLGVTGGGVGPCRMAGRILSGLALGLADE
ncbi:MAG: prephenate dehydrogenase/arogenate dehydrogenase family protein, partial [Syntrophobacteraceae bacterium]|nr:prephenate dehydrogenase/arogenate dehydrogenase family protein [Syntrophobacteraceae bacterium]